jgi:predicted amidohydrolase
VLIASLFERRAPGLYHNTAAILDYASGAPDNIAAIYRKMHIPDDPLYYEKFYFTPGDLGFLAQKTSAGRIGTLVCWDQWFPEGARVTALKGADAVLPYRDRLASGREGRVWRAAVRRVADDPAVACDCEWSVRVRGESRGA